MRLDGGIDLGGANSRAAVVIERCLFHDAHNPRLWLSTRRLKSLVLRGNVMVQAGPQLVGGQEVSDGMEVSNNTILGIDFHVAEGVPAGRVTARNNIIRWGIRVVGTPADAALGGWATDHNAMIDAPGHAERFKPGPTDRDGPAPFLSTVRDHPDYLRLPADNPLATTGAGGAWPAYAGALPPGPAPQGGDWFTRLRERWPALPKP